MKSVADRCWLLAMCHSCWVAPHIAVAGRSNKIFLSGIMAFAKFQHVGAGCERCILANLAKFARVVANFARKATKPSQKLKANVEISPTCESEIELEKGVLNS